MHRNTWMDLIWMDALMAIGMDEERRSHYQSFYNRSDGRPWAASSGNRAEWHDPATRR